MRTEHVMNTATGPTNHESMVIPTPQDMIKAHLKHLGQGGLSTNTVEDVGRVLRAVHRDLPEGLEADDEELTDWLANETWSRQTKATYRQHLRRFYAWALELGWVEHNPAAKLRGVRVPRRPPRPATAEQARIVTTDLPMPFLLHARLARWAGLRCIEVARLHREHVTEADINILGKGDKPAVQPNDPRIWELIEPLPPGPITRKPRSQRDVEHWVSTETAKQMRALGVDITMHRLRARYATTLLETTGNMELVRQLMRHESMETTRGYTLVLTDKLRQAVLDLPDD